jgi:hypothetical protein
MLNNEIIITRDTLLDAVAARIMQGFRFVTITCVSGACPTLDLIYHFDKDYVLHHLRLSLAHGEALPSISGVCAPAVLVENEIKDLFGIEVTGLAIDYEGRFILADKAPRAPMLKS